jgi:Phospholipase_D-nuclease N-terminal
MDSSSSLFSGALGLIFFAAWLSLGVIALLSVLRNQEHQLNLPNKILWAAIIIIVPFIGPLTYLIWKSSKKPEA